MDDWVEIGVFGEGEPYREKHRIRSGQQTITVTVPRKPTRAGIDPQNLLRRSMRPTRKETGFCRSVPVLCANDSAGVDPTVVKLLHQRSSDCIVSHNGNWRNPCAQRRKVVGRVGTTARYHPGLAVPQN